MTRPTKHIFSRGMAILFLVAFATALLAYAGPAASKVKENGPVKVEGDLDDIGFRSGEVGSGGGGTLSSGGGTSSGVSTLDETYIVLKPFDRFLIEFNKFWMQVLRR